MNKPTPESTSPSSRRRLLKWSLSALVVIAICTGAFVWWFFRGDAPDAVEYRQCRGAGAGRRVVDDRRRGDDRLADGGTAEQPAAEDSATNGVAGTWSVDAVRSGSSATRTRRGRSSGSGSTRSCQRSGRPRRSDALRRSPARSSSRARRSRR